MNEAMGRLLRDRHCCSLDFPPEKVNGPGLDFHPEMDLIEWFICFNIFELRVAFLFNG